MSSRCLILNMDYTFLGIADWRSAVCAVYSGKAVVEEEYDKDIHSVNLTIKMPAVIRLKKFVRVLYDRISYVSFTKRNVHIRDNYTCQYCGIKCSKDNTTIDHVIPESKEGRNSWDNCVTACSDCNYKKDDRTLAEAGMHLIRVPGRPRGFKEIIKIKLGEIHDLWLPYLK